MCHKTHHCGNLETTRELVSHANTILSSAYMEATILSLCTKLKTVDTRNHIPRLTKMDTKEKLGLPVICSKELLCKNWCERSL